MPRLAQLSRDKNHLLTDHVSTKQPHPIANIGELSMATIINSGRTFFT